MTPWGWRGCQPGAAAWSSPPIATASVARCRASWGPIAKIGRTGAVSEAHAFETNDQSTWSQVIDRECGSSTVGAGALGASMGREACVDELEAQAKNMVGEASARTRQSISGFEQLAGRLATMKTPVNVILISEGLYIGRDRNDLAQLARLAAQARLTFFVVQPDESIQDNDLPRTSGSFSEEVLAEGLEQLAGVTRGSYFKVVAGAAGVFDRISRELSGYYLLSFEPTEADRTSRDRRIRVEVSRRGLTVRARSTYALADPGPAASKDLRGAAPGRTGQEPARLPPSHARAPHSGRDLFGQQSRSESRAGRAFRRDRRSRDQFSGMARRRARVQSRRQGDRQQHPLHDAGARDQPRRVTSRPEHDDGPHPGEYTLRLAAIDHEGKYGSVHHTVDAQFHDIAGDAVRASDLMISSEVVEGGAPRPVPTGIQYSESMYSILELMGNDADRLSKSRVSIQIADSDTSPALFTAEAKPLPRGKTQRAYAALLRLDVLPPGEVRGASGRESPRPAGRRGHAGLPPRARGCGQ